MDKVTKKIIKTCGTPEHFCFDNIDGASVESDIRKMKEYVRCVNKVKKRNNYLK